MPSHRWLVGALAAGLMLLAGGISAAGDASDAPASGNPGLLSTEELPRGLVETTWLDERWAFATGDHILRSDTCVNAKPGCTRDAWFDQVVDAPPCYPQTRFFRLAGQQLRDLPMDRLGVGTFDGLFVRKGYRFTIERRILIPIIPDYLYTLHGHGPRFVSLQHWRDQSCADFDPNTTIVPGGPGALADYRLSIATSLPLACATNRGPLQSNLDDVGILPSRDCGFSEPTLDANQSLWVFCDTLFLRNGQDIISSRTSTVAVAPSGKLSPLPKLTELEVNGDAQFLPEATGINCPAVGDSIPYTPSWASGAIRMPRRNNPKMVIPYVAHCVQGAELLAARRFGIAEFDLTTRAFTHNATAVLGGDGSALLPPAERLGTPVYHARRWYFYAQCTLADVFAGQCASPGIYLARVRAPARGSSERPWANAANYEWWSGKLLRWFPSSATATNVVPGAAPIGGGLSVDRYDTKAAKRYVLLEQSGLQEEGKTEFRVWEASNPRGPWRLRTTSCIEGDEGPEAFQTRAITGHPELSTETQLTVSFYNAGSKRVELATLPW